MALAKFVAGLRHATPKASIHPGSCDMALRLRAARFIPSDRFLWKSGSVRSRFRDSRAAAALFAASAGWARSRFMR